MLKLRKITQILFLIFFIILFIKARYPYTGIPESDLFLRFSPLIPIFHFIAHLEFSWVFWPAMLILLITPFLGRMFCGWVCPLGTTLDITSKIFYRGKKKKKNISPEKSKKYVYIKFEILFASIFLAIFGVQVWGFVDPLSLLNRAMTVVIFPIVTIFTESSLNYLSDFSLLEDPAYWLLDNFKELIMPEKQQFLQQVIPVAIFFFAILFMEKFVKRFWCRYACPAGALLGLLSKFRFWGRKVSDNCTTCNICGNECRMGAIPTDNVQKTIKSECIQCISCQEDCPPKIKAIKFTWDRKLPGTSLNFSRRQFLGAFGVGALSWGILTPGIKNPIRKDSIIRPPGSIPENDFLEKCIRCMECVRICTSNGACLQPADWNNNFLELWTPKADMRQGYCEFNCNLCGEICPTDAILPLALAEKQKLPMGLAYFDKNMCIPFIRHEDCLVCEEHCPLPEKAIKFDIREAILPNGQTKMIKYPYVVRELCTGCGICEHKCPVPDKPGIFITAENEQRKIED